ncbi:uclacyanin [Trifolium repens]|nr:uclacyanin [Trifolium repens]
MVETKKEPTKRLIPLETLIAPLSFGGGGGEVVFVPEEGVDGVSVFGGVVDGVPLGVFVGGGVPLGVGVVLAATTLISSFMPPAQCPIVGHMKYCFPALVNATFESPPL